MSMRPQGQWQNNQYLMSCPKKKCKTQISWGFHELMETFSDSFQDLYWKYPFQFLWLCWECASECDILDFFGRGEHAAVKSVLQLKHLFRHVYVICWQSDKPQMVFYFHLHAYLHCTSVCFAQVWDCRDCCVAIQLGVSVCKPAQLDVS